MLGIHFFTEEAELSVACRKRVIYNQIVYSENTAL